MDGRDMTRHRMGGCLTMVFGNHASLYSLNSPISSSLPYSRCSVLRENCLPLLAGGPIRGVVSPLAQSPKVYVLSARIFARFFIGVLGWEREDLLRGWDAHSPSLSTAMGNRGEVAAVLVEARWWPHPQGGTHNKGLAPLRLLRKPPSHPPVTPHIDDLLCNSYQIS